MNVTVIIAAAGRSERFGATDKLSSDLGGRPVLIRSVELFTRREEVRTILVAGPPEGPDLDAFRERYGATLGFHGGTIVAGGATARWETIQRALAHVPEDATHVAIHDAARPGTPNAVIGRTFEAAESVDAVIPVIPIQGTIKRVAGESATVNRQDDDDLLADLILGDAGKSTIETRAVEATIDRTNLVEVQTPQVFARSLIMRAYAEADLDGTTDDASVVERLGESVQSVPGDPRNLKITTPADLEMMRTLTGHQADPERPAHKRF